MIYDRTERHPGARFLLVLASIVVVVWGLQFARPVLLPTALALFLAVLVYPLVAFLRGKRVPAVLAISTGIGIMVGVAALVILLGGQALSELRSEGPRYFSALQARQMEWMARLREAMGDLGEQFFGTGTGQELLPLNVSPDFLLGFLGNTAQVTAALLAQAVLVVLVMAFILSEMTVLPSKLEAIFGSSIKGEERLQKVVREIQEYLGIKTVVSVLTGLAIGGWAAFMGLDFPILLGLIGFVLNYIPTVGSIIASIPGIALSLILVGTLGHALVVGFGYFVINTVFGSILEPNLMGRRLGLSTLVVILSLLFWAWTWGPVGALLSVPLTMVVKIFLENTRDLRWAAVLLDKRAPASTDVEPLGLAGAGDAPPASASQPPRSVQGGDLVPENGGALQSRAATGEGPRTPDLPLPSTESA